MPVLVEKFKRNLARRYRRAAAARDSRSLHGRGPARAHAGQRVRRPVRSLMRVTMAHNNFDTLQSFKHGKLHSPACPGAKVEFEDRSGCRSRSASSSSRCCATATARRSPRSTCAQLASWQPNAKRTEEIPFVLARILLQDFTGVPLLCDLAAMRGVAEQHGQGSEGGRAAGAGRPGGRPLGADRPLRHQERARPQHEARVQAQRGALPVHEVGHAGVRHLQGRAAGHRHRATR